jgi:hypothetical protein
LGEYAAALLVIAVLVGTLATTKFSRRGQRWVLIGLVLLASFVLFKDGFVRHDAHSVQLFGLFALLPQHAFHVLAAPDCAAPQMEGRNFERMKLTDRDGSDGEAYGVTFFRIPFSC